MVESDRQQHTLAPKEHAMQQLERIPSVRITPDNQTVLNNLGLLKDLAGTWKGEGFNLIARPNFEGHTNLYLQLNRTRETLKIDPIGSSIPNRGFGQNDIELFGLTYLDQIADLSTGGALHIEPGIWVTQPGTNYPLEPDPGASKLVARMATIPHGSSVLAAGTATPFSGPPTLSPGAHPVSGGNPAFSLFPSFNSTPFPTSAAGTIVNAAGSSEKLTAAVAPGFTEYDLSVPESATNPRTPFGTSPAEPALPSTINGVPMQDIVNDPITLLQQVVKLQADRGDTFEGVAINIATQKSITFFTSPNSKAGAPTTTVQVTDGAGGIENILFLEGGEPAGAQGPNADTALVYATFWIEKVTPKDSAPFMQLQYAQMTVLNFAILTALPKVVVLGWPHISVATLTKTFN
jgi:hypothetical protein